MIDEYKTVDGWFWFTDVCLYFCLHQSEGPGCFGQCQDNDVYVYTLASWTDQEMEWGRHGQILPGWDPCLPVLGTHHRASCFKNAKADLVSQLLPRAQPHASSAHCADCFHRGFALRSSVLADVITWCRPDVGSQRGDAFWVVANPEVEKLTFSSCYACSSPSSVVSMSSFGQWWGPPCLHWVERLVHPDLAHVCMCWFMLLSQIWVSVAKFGNAKVTWVGTVFKEWSWPEFETICVLAWKSNGGCWVHCCMTLFSIEMSC